VLIPYLDPPQLTELSVTVAALTLTVTDREPVPDRLPQLFVVYPMVHDAVTVYVPGELKDAVTEQDAVLEGITVPPDADHP
jgi:hypothetical protein